MHDELTIRRALVADAEVLAALAERTFRQTFTEQNTVADMEAYVAESFSVPVTRAELGQHCNLFLLASGVADGEPLGYAKLREAEPDPSVEGAKPIELERLYVDRPGLGKGVGAALMRACLETAREEGFETLWLGVWEENARAIRFYEKWDFRHVGEHDFQLGSDIQTDWIMERGVGARQASSEPLV